MSHILRSAKEGVAADDPPTPTDPSLVRAAWNGTRRFRPVLVLLAGLVVVLSLLEPSFFGLVNLQNVATSVSVLWIVALGRDVCSAQRRHRPVLRCRRGVGWHLPGQARQAPPACRARS